MRFGEPLVSPALLVSFALLVAPCAAGLNRAERLLRQPTCELPAARLARTAR